MIDPKPMICRPPRQTASVRWFTRASVLAGEDMRPLLRLRTEVHPCSSTKKTLLESIQPADAKWPGMLHFLLVPPRGPRTISIATALGDLPIRTRYLGASWA